MIVLYMIHEQDLSNPALIQACLEQLPDARRQKVLRFRHCKDQALSLAASVSWSMAARIFGADVCKEEIEYNPLGKPFFKNRPDLSFSLSHSGSFGAAALSPDTEVGLDVQQTIILDLKLQKRICTQAELERLERIPENRRAAALTQLWAMKESFMKLEGSGLNLGLQNLDVSFEPDLSIRWHGKKMAVSFQVFEKDGCIFSLCSQKPREVQIKCVKREELKAWSTL